MEREKALDISCPEIFFGVLVENRLTVAEAYLLSVPYLSWKMVLVGDPLYRPFGR
jgi:hypothetical protein